MGSIRGAGSLGIWDTSARREGIEDGSVLVPSEGGETSPQALELARTIAIGRDAELVALDIVCPPEQTPLELAARSLDERHENLTAALETVDEVGSGISAKGAVHVGRNPVSILVEAAESFGARVIVVDGSWSGNRLGPLVRTPLGKLTDDARCPVVLPTGDRLPEQVSSVLVPVAGGPHSAHATEVARVIAGARDAHVELLHVVPSSEESRDGAAGTEILDVCASHLRGFDDYDTWLLEAESVEDAIIEQSRYYQVTVIGGPRTPRLRRFVLGSTSNTVREHGSNCVVTVWS